MTELDSKLNFLLNYLNNNNLKKESKIISRIIKTSEMDYPIEEIDIDSKDELFNYLKENPGEFIYLDNPLGSTKSFGGNKKVLPFDYGEFPSLINPADDMGWDVVIVPSFKGGSEIHIDRGHLLIPIGYIPINSNKKDWDDKASKPPPIGNDKIILAPNGEYSGDDLRVINDFFSTLWQYEEMILL